jgi:hypothetical protein
MTSVSDTPARTRYSRRLRRPLQWAVAALLAMAPLLGAAPANAATSPTITSFSTGDDYVRVGTWVPVTAQLSTPIDNSTYFVRLIDLTTGATLTQCYSGSACTYWVSSSIAATHSYTAHLDSGRGGPAPYPIVSASATRAVNWVSTLPTLTAGRISFHTNDEDRDWDTMVTVNVYRRDGVEVASALLPAAHFDDNSDNGPFALSTQGLGGTTWDQMRGGWLQISINANGNDTWRFNYSAQLNFSNGRYLTVGRNGVQMSDDRTFSWPINF